MAAQTRETCWIGENAIGHSLRCNSTLAHMVIAVAEFTFQIFGHLWLQDILNLSRTTKYFRRILMHRSAKFVWKAAQENVPDLPSVPPGMVVPQWTNLLYEQTCNVRVI